MPTERAPHSAPFAFCLPLPSQKSLSFFDSPLPKPHPRHFPQATPLSNWDLAGLLPLLDPSGLHLSGCGLLGATEEEKPGAEAVSAAEPVCGRRLLVPE